MNIAHGPVAEECNDANSVAAAVRRTPLPQTPPARTIPPPFTLHHQEALELEIRLLQAILYRNGTSHRKTQYFRRLTMALRSILAHNNTNKPRDARLNAVWADAQRVTQKITEGVRQWEKDVKQSRKRALQTKRRKDVFWELIDRPEAAAVPNDNKNPPQPPIPLQSQTMDSVDTTSSSTEPMASRQQQQHRILVSLAVAVRDLSHRTQTGIDAAVSRLEYAAAACGTEIARGFFLPLLTTAVAAVARLRTLLLRLQTHVARQQQDCYRRILFATTTSSSSVGSSTSNLLQQQRLDCSTNSRSSTMNDSENDSEEWCMEEFRKVLAVATDQMMDVLNKSGSPGNSPTSSSSWHTLPRAERTHASLQSLGIILSNKEGTKVCVPVVATNQVSTTVLDDKNQDVDKVSHYAQDDNDIGESLEFHNHCSTLLPSINIGDGGDKNGRVSQPLATSVATSGMDDAGVDHNANVLAILKNKKKKLSENSGGKRKDPATKNQTPKKKKKDNNDFFDNLFG